MMQFVINNVNNNHRLGHKKDNRIGILDNAQKIGRLEYAYEQEVIGKP